MTKKTKKTVGILGGAFNPPHDGHMALAVLATKHFDEVWIMPCNNHVHGKRMTDAKSRLSMCQLAVVSHFPKIRASGFEVINRFQGSSYEMLVKLKKEEVEERDFSFIIGQDNADDIESWMHFDQLISETPFFVVPRKGYDRKKTAWYTKDHHIYLADLSDEDAILEISSTSIRDKIRHGKDPKHIDKMVRDYIRDRRLYIDSN